MKNGRLKAVIWDMDGVLVNSEPVHFATWRIVFERYGLPFNEESLRQTFGMTSPEVIRRIGGESLSDELAALIIGEKETLFRDMIKGQAAYLPGSREWLDGFQQQGLRQALASSGSPENIAVILSALNAHAYFDVVVSGRDLPSKPEPRIFLQAAHLLGVLPHECLVIEDAIAGVSAAKAAGMTCLALSTTNKPEDLSGADLICTDLSELQPDTIQRLFCDPLM